MGAGGSSGSGSGGGGAEEAKGGCGSGEAENGKNESKETRAAEDSTGRREVAAARNMLWRFWRWAAPVGGPAVFFFFRQVGL